MARYIGMMAISQYSFQLTAAAVAVKGELALLNPATGKLVVGAVAEGLIPIGHYNEDLTGTGTNLCNVRLFKEIFAYRFTNASSSVTAAMVGAPCYVQTGSSVSGVATGKSVAGLVLEVDATLGVLVWTELAAAITTALALVP